MNIIGVNKCDPEKEEWTANGGYDEDCCTTSNPCGEKQGGCKTISDCGGGDLVCSGSSTGCGSKFDTASGEKCCHIEGNISKYSGCQRVYLYTFSTVQFLIDNCYHFLHLV